MLRALTEDAQDCEAQDIAAATHVDQYIASIYLMSTPPIFEFGSKLNVWLRGAGKGYEVG
jgi:hypothetical protein